MSISINIRKVTNSLKMGLRRNSRPVNRDDISTIILFAKMLLSIVIGTFFGVLGMTGIFTILFAICASNVSVMLYVRHFLDLDDDDIENYEIYTESFMPTFSSFMLFWIVSYSSVF